MPIQQAQNPLCIFNQTADLEKMLPVAFVGSHSQG